MKLSILIPSIPSRIGMMCRLYDRLLTLVCDLPTEILALTDNKKRSIGLKRDALLKAANGEYICFLDDDDEIYDNYVDVLYTGVSNCNGADVISITQHAQIENENKFLVSFGVDNENQECYKKDNLWQDITRKPFHTCVWRRELAQRHDFPDASYGEDWHWAKRVLCDVKSEYHIGIPIMCYHYRAAVTEAAHTFPE